jgi:MraZ protein
MLLTGTYERSIDDKLRVAIPKHLRDRLGDAETLVLYVALGTDGSLAVYTEAALSQLASRLAQASPTQEDVRAYARLFYARAQPVELDGQGRVRIPPDLAREAGLEREAVLLGVQDHLELWDRKRWEAYLADNASRYDHLAEAAFARPKEST